MTIPNRGPYKIAPKNKPIWSQFVKKRHDNIIFDLCTILGWFNWYLDNSLQEVIFKFTNSVVFQRIFKVRNLRFETIFIFIDRTRILKNSCKIA
jgi:hypothetical protein